jgi:dihydroorotate dehydrogenase (NAD+) catalytic subunit
MATDLSVAIASLKLKNPTMLASGILGETGASLKRVAKHGAGALVTKSIGIAPKKGYANPTAIELEHGLLNAMGLPNPGYKNYVEELRTALEAGVPVIASIFGADQNEFIEVGKALADAGAHALELNLSCPHAKHYGAELGQRPDVVADITRAVKSAVNIPVFVKITPNTHDIVALAKAAENAKADAIVAVNTLRAMAIDIDSGMPLLGNKVGGYSGPAIKPVGVRCVYDIAENVRKTPLIGVGGISTGNDVIEYLMAGASAVQIGSAVHYRGIDVFQKISDEIADWMKRKGCKSVSELVGKAHQSEAKK